MIPKRRLRFAVLVDELQINRWQFECVSLLVKSGVCHLDLVILAVPPWRQRMCSKLMVVLRHLLWFAFVATMGRPESSRRAETNLFSARHIQTIKVTNSATFIELPDVEVEHLRARQFDFVIYLGEKIPHTGISGIAKDGVWTFAHGDQSGRTAQPLGFWEIVHRLPVTCVALRRFTPDGPAAGTLLRQGFFPVTPHSYARTVDAARAGSIDFPLLASEDLLRGTNSGTRRGHVHAGHVTLPKVASVMLLLARLFRAKVSALLSGLFTRIQWNVGLINMRDLDPLAVTQVSNVRWFPNKRTEAFGVADPFCRRSGNGLVLLTENMKNERGVIVAWRLTGDCAVSLGIGIEERVHLSYPYLCESNGDVYCVPEQCESGSVVLYRAIEFPKRWERVADILSNVKAVDSTLFQFGPYWWLAYTEVRPAVCSSGCYWPTRLDSVTRLMLWYAKDLEGPWAPHPCNPVKIDPRSSRGAGTPFYYNGMFIRPSQDCSVSYGAKVVFNHVITLTPTQFEEETIGELRPDVTGPYPDGLHTVSCDGDLAVIDGCRRLFDPVAWFAKIRTREKRVRAVHRDIGPGVSCERGSSIG